MNLVQEIEQWTPLAKALGAMAILFTFAVLVISACDPDAEADEDGR